MHNSGSFPKKNANFLEMSNVNWDFFRTLSVYDNSNFNQMQFGDYNGFDTMESEFPPADSTYVVRHSMDKLDFINSTSATFPMRSSLSPRANRTEFITNDIFYECSTDLEPPLFDELEIYPQIILGKVKFMLNPLKQCRKSCEEFGAEFDLPAPILFSLLLACCIFLMGKEVTFQHVYILCVLSVFGLYGLLQLLKLDTDEKPIAAKFVASVLGYGLVHTLWLAFFRLFIHLDNIGGFILIAFSVYCSTLGTSRIITSSMTDNNNRLSLIAFPTAIIYSLFALFVIF